ncbi:MAG TPA: DUF3050 domain-containing protein [Flavobacteriaceae bacterium]|nr:DUF3050 domain-containing protein [Flavobacteriaceae bacterium]
MIKKLENSIEKERKKLLNHKFLELLSQGVYKQNELKIFAEQYYLLSNSFCNFLFYACINIKSEEDRLPILINLWDENGNGNIKLSHRTLLKKFLDAVDKNINVENIVPLDSTKCYIANMLDLYKNSSVVEILSSLGTGCESLTTEQYKIILKSLRENYKFNDNELIFFIEHVYHDPKHSSDINIILEKLLRNNNMQKAINSAKKAIHEEIKFWDGLYEACKKSNKN